MTFLQRLVKPSSSSGGATSADAPPAAQEAGTDHAVRLRRPIEGRVVALSTVPDPTFAAGIVGPGVAIEPDGDETVVIAPASGVVSHIFDTCHAVALTLDTGIELLIHVGLDTVVMQGEGFRPLVSIDDRVAEGQPLIRADLAKVRAAGHSTVSPVVVLNDSAARIEM